MNWDNIQQLLQKHASQVTMGADAVPFESTRADEDTNEEDDVPVEQPIVHDQTNI